MVLAMYSRWVGLLDVNTAGLQALATNCDGWAAELTTASPPASAATSLQPSAAAVSGIHAEAAMVGKALAARMHSTGAKLVDAGAHYSANEAESATTLTNLTTEL
jgi:hypothetical protein